MQSRRLGMIGSHRARRFSAQRSCRDIDRISVWRRFDRTPIGRTVGDRYIVTLAFVGVNKTGKVLFVVQKTPRVVLVIVRFIRKHRVDVGRGFRMCRTSWRKWFL